MTETQARHHRPVAWRLILTFLTAGLLPLVLAAGPGPALAAGPGPAPETAAAGGPDAGSEIATVRSAVARYHTTERAEAAGWQLVPGLGHCFEHPALGGMGVHYLDGEQLANEELDPRRPEALVFVPGPTGQLRLGAVEYLVPIQDPDEPGEPPEVLGHELHQLEPVTGVHVWGLHVWLFEPNPAGTFADFNPRVSCDGLDGSPQPLSAVSR